MSEPPASAPDGQPADDGPTPDDGAGEQDRAGSLTGRTVSGLAWVYAGTIGGLVLQTVYTGVMNRLLTPTEFGLVASAQVVLQFGRFMSELGLGPALIQRPNLTRDEIRVAVTTSALLGVVLTGVMLVAAPALELFFQEPGVVPVFRALSFSLLANALTIVPLALLSRQLRFKEQASLELGSFFVGYLILGIGSATFGLGVYSLIVATVSQLVIVWVVGTILTKPPLAPSLRLSRARRLYSFGGKISVITLLEYVFQVAPTAIVGRYAGISRLGQFSRASLLIDLPVTNLTYALSRVLFPAISQVQHDRVRVRGAYISAMRVSGALIVPMVAGLSVAADEVVRLVLGDQWGTAAELVPYLGIAAAFRILAHYGGIVCEALDILNIKLVMNVVLTGGLIVGLLQVPTGNLIGYASVLAVSWGVSALAYAWLMGRELSIPIADQLGLYLRPVAGGLVVAATIYGATAALEGTALPVGLVVLVQVAVGAATLGPLLWFGPLRRARHDVLGRLVNAGLDDKTGRLPTTVMRILRIGGVRAV